MESPGKAPYGPAQLHHFPVLSSLIFCCLDCGLGVLLSFFLDCFPSIHNGILLSHKKEWSWAICRDVDGTRACHTQWSKSGREKQTLYNNTYVEPLKMVQMNLFAGREKRSIHKEWMCGDREGGGGGVSRRLRLTYIPCHIWNRQLVGTCL